MKENPTKFRNKYSSWIWTFFGVIFMAFLVMAVTTITETDITTENITTGLINDINLSNLDNTITVGFSDADYIVDGTNDHIQIEDAINNLSTATASGQSFVGGGRVFIKNGTYDIGDTINITNSNVMLEGAGWGTILKAKNNLDKHIIEVGDGSTTYRNIIISNLQIDGDKPNQGATSYGIYFNVKVQRSIIKNVFVYRTQNDCIHLFQSADNLIIDNYIEDCGDIGIVLSGGGRSKIIGNTMDTVQGTGIQIFAENDNIINNNIVLTSFQHGIQLAGGSYNSINGNTIEDSSFGTNNTFDGISLEVGEGLNSTYNSIIGNIITSQSTFDGDNQTQHCIDEFNTEQDFNFIINNICQGSISGIRIQGISTSYFQRESLKIIANTTTMTCNGASQGGIYYDGNDKTFFGCNSTDWLVLGV